MLKNNQQYYRLRSGLTILPSHQQALDKLLSELIEKIPARFVILSDVTGQMISARGGHQDNINLVALSSLLAGDLAASQEISRLTGEYENQQLVLREGQASHTFICEAGNYLAMMVQVSNEVPLGWARMLIKKAAQELPTIIETEPEPESLPMEDISQEDDSTEDILDDENFEDLFDDALDGLWME